MTEHTTTLKRTLGSFRLWGIAVGLVISGEYFGWSYGWSQAGTMGFMVVALAVAAMYCAFIFSFTELTTAIPHAGGPFAYAYRAFGPTGGFIAGFATLIEFVFAPPAIAMAIGAYLNVQFPALDPKWVACGAYVIFMTLNILGVGIAATFELIVTLLAIFELLVFMGVVAPGFSWSHFTTNGWAGRTASAAWRCRGCSPPFRSPSGSSSPLRGPPWPPKRPKIRSAPFPAPWAAAF
ncbi:ethanolamine permease [Klebsiella pneumoniae subsp. rhinoscleromatis]|nr:ethanolamine permease [Klebsiella pneumoniae subsp. rhinoscleromatis]